MNIDKRLELLKKIQQVDTPPFLLTRIMEYINSSTIEKAPTTWQLAFVCVAVIVLSLNASIFFSSADRQNKNSIEEVVQSLELTNSNHLYND